MLRAGAGACSLAPSTAGCLGLSASDDSPRYRLSTRRIGPSLAPRFDWDADDADPFARDLADRIVDRGEVATAGFSLDGVGTHNPRYVERDGAYYEVAVAEAGTVTRTRWLLWFDRVDADPPAGAEVYVSSLGLGDPTRLDAAYGLSEADVRAVEDAEGRIATESGFLDVADRPPERRGHLFVRRSADGTDLVPDPPFDYATFESGDGTVYARAVVEEVSVDLTRYVHTATPVAESADAYERHLRETYLRTAFDDVSDAQRSVLDAATGGGEYEETAPLSDGFAAVLERLGVDDTRTPEPRRVEFSEHVYFAYEGTYYEGQLEIFG
ncbi:hypothetical protein K933_14828 [Candidatus Halobonum tyrrellensis G22]|uniref:Uncharacterized protein n=1 Tax=Candidatus Halobonum tyrrellensis G22 TaxID=1324957 RepID=V4H9L4_9EURY|nr:hypothetical protein K933_14828 [Candidatus Halobonum tyrrellensis G22]